MPAPNLIKSLAEISRLASYAPSVILDVTQLGATRLPEYQRLWPRAHIYAYLPEPADEPCFFPIPLRLSHWPDWGARTSACHGLLAELRIRQHSTASPADWSLESTVDIFAEEHKLRQISLLVLPASYSALETLLGASNLLAWANIMAVAILDQRELETIPGMLGEIAGILGKFGYRWASIDGAAVSVAIHDRAEGILLPPKPSKMRLPWLDAAQGFHVPLKGIIHVGDSETRELDLYREAKLGVIFIIGPNAHSHRRLTERVSEASNITYINARLGEQLALTTEEVATGTFPSDSEVEVQTLDSLAMKYDLWQCNLLHIELPAISLSGISSAANTMRHVDIIDVEFKRGAENSDTIELADLDARLRQHGFIRISIRASVYPFRDHAVYVRKETLWTEDPLKAAGIALQHADSSTSRVGFIGDSVQKMLGKSIPLAEHQQSFGVSMPRNSRYPSLTQIARPNGPLTIETLEQRVEVTYVLKHLERECAAQSGVNPAAPSPEIDLLVLSHDAVEIFRKTLEATKSSTRLSAIILLGSLSDKDMAAAILIAFDHGFLLDRSTAASTGRIFVRSELIREAGRWLSQNNSYGNRQFRFSSLGELGRFGNQLFQLWHLILSGLRHNASISTRKWDFQEYFAVEFIERAGRGDILSVEPHEWRVMGLWALESLPDGIDFHGHFQWIPPFLQRHRVLLSRIFDLRPEWAREMSKVIMALRSSGRPLSAFHVRRTDYLNRSTPWMGEIPISWYKAALEKLRDTTIYAASDDLEFVRRELPEFTLLSFEDFAEISLPPLLIDHCVMRAADTLLLVNSTFSRSAAMMGKERQATLLPSLHLQSFQPYAPWNDPVFWRRFETSDATEYSKRSAEVQDWLRSAGLTE